ncbi:AI-2E family transporter [Vallitalea okinawensis]|uniref:AI-2E family transporter n=1 Tax=Vallitalea okinawensis TaxID=2078660 RepID=UPI000CFBE80D|nr:AI-2E family transporter [Vallitalea okinawensis]
MNKKDIQKNYYKLIPPALVLVTLSCLIFYFVFQYKGLSLIYNAIGTVVIAFVMIYLLKPIVDFYERKIPIKRGLAILLAFLTVIAIIILMFVLFIPSLVDSVKTFAKDIPTYSRELESLSYQLLAYLSNTFDVEDLVTQVQEFLMGYSSTIINFGTDLIGSIALGATSVVTLTFNFIIAIFMAWYALVDAEAMQDYTKRFVKAVFRPKTANYIIKVTHLTDKAVKNFLVSKLITCIILGFLVYIGIIIANLFGLDIPYAPLFGLIIGLTNIIPYVGPLMGTIPCLIITLLTGIPETVALLGIVLLMQQVDNIFVGPKILGDSLGVKPFWVVASVAIGGSLFGAIGMVLSVPIVAVIQTLLTEYIESKEAIHMATIPDMHVTPKSEDEDPRKE